jgi:hypothetical protein
MAIYGALASISVLGFTGVAAQSTDDQQSNSPTTTEEDEGEITLFHAPPSVVVAKDGLLDHRLEGTNLNGLYGTFKQAVPGAMLEPYILWRVAPGNAGLSETANRSHRNETTTGVRAAGTLPASFNYKIVMDRQTSTLGLNSIRSWAGYWTVGRTFRSVSTTRLFVKSNYASGTRNPNGYASPFSGRSLKAVSRERDYGYPFLYLTYDCQGVIWRRVQSPGMGSRDRSGHRVPV